MLARSGPIPRGRGWTFEPKLDGFRCLVCTHAGFRAPLPPRLEHGAATAGARGGAPGRRPARRRARRARRRRPPRLPPARRPHAPPSPRNRVTLFVFDVLAVEGLPVTA